MVDSRDRERKRRQAVAGQSSTMLTGAAGVTDAAPIAQKQLLGQ